MEMEFVVFSEQEVVNEMKGAGIIGSMIVGPDNPLPFAIDGPTPTPPISEEDKHEMDAYYAMEQSKRLALEYRLAHPEIMQAAKASAAQRKEEVLEESVDRYKRTGDIDAFMCILGAGGFDDSPIGAVIHDDDYFDDAPMGAPYHD